MLVFWFLVVYDVHCLYTYTSLCHSCHHTRRDRRGGTQATPADWAVGCLAFFFFFFTTAQWPSVPPPSRSLLSMVWIHRVAADLLFHLWQELVIWLWFLLLLLCLVTWLDYIIPSFFFCWKDGTPQTSGSLRGIWLVVIIWLV